MTEEASALMALAWVLIAAAMMAASMSPASPAGISRTMKLLKIWSAGSSAGARPAAASAMSLRLVADVG